MKIFLNTFLLLLLSIAQPSFAQLNQSLVKQLDTILQTDQQYRKIKNATPRADTLNMKLQDELDLRNLKKVEKIIAEFGYPGKSMVGAKHQSTAFLVIQHNDTKAQERLFPILQDAVERGELTPGSLAIMIDRIKTGKGEKQIYGSQLLETKAGIKIFPIDDEQNVDIRRAKLGLPPIAAYYKTWKLDYKVPTATFSNQVELYYSPTISTVEVIGGDSSIFKRLQYPSQAKTANIKGKVLVEFTVDVKGNTKDINVVQSLGKECDEEAVRVIRDTKYNNTTGEERAIRMNLPFPYVTR